MIFKLYWYFGLTGTASLALWICALILQARFWRSRRRTFFYSRALCLAVIAWLLASMNFCNVSLIQADRTLELEEAKQRQMEAREAEMKALKERAADVHFVEDDKYDYYDLAGVEGDEKKSVFELAAEGKDAEPLYRQAGKQKRDGAPDGGQETENDGELDALEQPASGRVMPERDRIRATRLARLNLKTAKTMVLVAIFLLIFDYLCLFNTTFNAVLPLPFSGRVMDYLFPKKRSLLLRSGRPALTTAYIESVIRKGEGFLYFGHGAVLDGLNVYRIHIPFRDLGIAFVGLFRFPALAGAWRRVKSFPAVSAAGRFLSVRLASPGLTSVRSAMALANESLRSLGVVGAGALRGARAWLVSLRGRSIGGRTFSGWGSLLAGLPIIHEVCSVVSGWTCRSARAVRDLFATAVVRDGAFDMMPARVVRVSPEEPPLSNEFIFESAWFIRYSFAIGDGERASAMIRLLLEFLGDRYRPHAAAWKTVHIVWDRDPAELDRSDLDRLLFLAAEANFKMVLFAPDPGSSELLKLVDESHDEDLHGACCESEIA